MLVNIIPMWCFLLALYVVGVVEPLRHDVNEMMYVAIPGGSACFRRMNGTHQFGCSSPSRGANGVIEVLHDDTSFDQFISNAVAGPYVVVMPPLLFSRLTIDKLIASRKVNGVVLALSPGTTLPEHYSPDDVCPNRNEGFCDTSSPNKTWNPVGNNFLRTDIPFPIFLVQDEEYLDNITQCYKKFNEPVDSSQLSKHLCMLQLKSHMYGAVNSQVCTRRMVYQMMSVFKYCDPLGGENIIHSMINLNDTKERKLIAVIARLDGASLFDGIGPGAMSAVSGTASLIVIANILKDLLPTIRDHQIYKGIMFMLLNGESFDYIGSQRIVYDMEQGNFVSSSNKISLEDITLVIELSQLGPGKTFYVHRTADAEAFAGSILRISKDKNFTIDFKLASLNPNNLPPVSVNTFRQANPNISAIVITNYDTSFTNNYYNGLFDNGTNMQYKNESLLPAKSTVQHNLAAVSMVMAQAIARAVNQDDSISYDVNRPVYTQTMNDVLLCYLESRKCPLFQKLYPSLAINARGPETLSLYVGIPTSVSHITRATAKVLAYLANTKKENSTLVRP